jgi:hypothetical protein
MEKNHPFSEVEVGDIVQSYDFYGRYDCFYIGVVESLEHGMMKCRAKMRVWAGEVDEPTDETFQAPVQGASYMDETFEKDGFRRVILLRKGERAARM